MAWVPAKNERKTDMYHIALPNAGADATDRRRKPEFSSRRSDGRGTVHITAAHQYNMSVEHKSRGALTGRNKLGECLILDAT